MTTTPRTEAPALLDHRFPLPTDRPFTTRQAVEAGLTRHVLARLLREGLCRRMLRGVLVAAQAEDGLLLRAQALALVVPDHAAVTDWTACWLWTGVLPPGEHLTIPPVSVFRLPGCGRLRNTLCRSGERAFRPGDLRGVAGTSVTSPIRTAWDLGRLAHRDKAIGALDALLRHGTFSREELVGGVERFARQRGVVQLRALARLADARAESPAESVLRLRWLDLPTLPAPTPQVPILGPAGEELARIDLGVQELRFGAEYDGEQWHSADEDRDHDEERRTWLRQRHRWHVEPLRRHNVFGPARDVDRILVQGVIAARRRLGEPALPT